MKFLRTASTSRLLASIAGLVLAIAAGTAIAVASTNSGQTPPAKPLASALHQAASAPSVPGISARITFTNGLIDSSDFTASDTVDPLLQGASGRLWLSADHRLRIELQSPNGDAQVIVNNGSFWISDPSTHTVYEGTLPAGKTDKAKPGKSADSGVPTVAEIQSDLNRLMGHVDLSGVPAGSKVPTPTNVAGRPAYRVKISPKHDGGLLSSVQLAWDAAKGIPLDVGIYAVSSNTPVLELQATSISYHAMKDNVFAMPLPAGYTVTRISSAQQSKLTKGAARHAKSAKKVKVSGAAVVAGKVPFLSAPKSLDGLPRHDVSLLSSGGKPGALVTYGQNLGGIVVIEQKADAGTTAATTPLGSRDGLSLPTVTIPGGVTGKELSTPLGTVISFTRDQVNYTVLGSVPAKAAELAAQQLPTTPTIGP